MDAALADPTVLVFATGLTAAGGAGFFAMIRQRVLKSALSRQRSLVRERRQARISRIIAPREPGKLTSDPEKATKIFLNEPFCYRNLSGSLF